MQIPKTLTAGDSWSWTDDGSLYPATDWVLSYHLRGPSIAGRFTIAGTAASLDHVFSKPATETKDLPGGDYEWIARVVSLGTGEALTLSRGNLQVDWNLANLAADNRTHNRKVLEALEAVIENRANTDQQSMSIAGRSLSRMTWDELLAAYDRFKLAVAKENGKRPGKVLLRTGLA